MAIRRSTKRQKPLTRERFLEVLEELSEEDFPILICSDDALLSAITLSDRAMLDVHMSYIKHTFGKGGHIFIGIKRKSLCAK